MPGYPEITNCGTQVCSPFNKDKKMLGTTIIFILIGCLAGFLAGKLMRGGGFGFIVNSVLGIIGGLVGGWLLSLIGISWGGLIGQIGTAVIGAVVILAIASLFNKKGKK